MFPHQIDRSREEIINVIYPATFTNGKSEPIRHSYFETNRHLSLTDGEYALTFSDNSKLIGEKFGLDYSLRQNEDRKPVLNNIPVVISDGAMILYFSGDTCLEEKRT